MQIENSGHVNNDRSARRLQEVLAQNWQSTLCVGTVNVAA